MRTITITSALLLTMSVAAAQTTGTGKAAVITDISTIPVVVGKCPLRPGAIDPPLRMAATHLKINLSYGTSSEILVKGRLEAIADFQEHMRHEPIGVVDPGETAEELACYRRSMIAQWQIDIDCLTTGRCLPSIYQMVTGKDPSYK